MKIPFLYYDWAIRPDLIKKSDHICLRNPSRSKKEIYPDHLEIFAQVCSKNLRRSPKEIYSDVLKKSVQICFENPHGFASHQILQKIFLQVLKVRTISCSYVGRKDIEVACWKLSSSHCSQDNFCFCLWSGLYPNVCMHKEKRKVLTTEARAALIHKSSVNCSREPVLPARLNFSHV